MREEDGEPMIRRRDENTIRTSALAALALAVGLAGPAVALAPLDPSVVSIEPVPCVVGAPPDDSVACLVAWLPMSWDALDAQGRLPDDAPRVGVHVVVLENPTRSSDPNPIVVLSGGPGQAGSDTIPLLGPALELRRNRAILLVDQRGTGHSKPSLACPEIAATELDDNRFNDPTLGEADPLAARFAACRARLVAEGVALDAFDTRAAARDLHAIRTALGIPRWNLLGTSYGARLALDAMRVDPDGIRSVVLNSPLSNVPDREGRRTAARPALFEALYRDCAADPACAARYGDLEGAMRRLADHLGEGPMVLTFREPTSGAVVRKDVYFDDVVTALYQHMSFAQSVRAVPRFLFELAEVARGRLGITDEETAAIFQTAHENIVDGLSIGMHLSVRCREDVPFESAEAEARIMAAHDFYFPAGEPDPLYAALCPLWDVGTAPDAFGEPVASDIPVLILTGDSDPLTPTEEAHEIARTLPRAQLVAFRGQPHDLFGALMCARVLTANFIEDPDAPVDTACLERMRPFFE